MHCFNYKSKENEAADRSGMFGRMFCFEHFPETMIINDILIYVEFPRALDGCDIISFCPQRPLDLK